MPKKKLTPPTWDEKNNRWKKTAYCNGMSKTFYSNKRGATSAEREITAAINQWKDKMEGLTGAGHLTPMSRVKDVYPDFLADLQARTSVSNYRPVDGRFRKWVLPMVGNHAVSELSDGLVQKIINNAYTKGSLSKKTLRNLRADVSQFAKFCRKNQISEYIPEDIDLPRSAQLREKKILQPDELHTLFSVDTKIVRNKPIREEYINAYRLQVLHCLRPGEVGGLRKTDRIGDTVQLQRAINDYNEITKGKNENAVRSFVLSDLGKQIWDAQCRISTDNQLFPEYSTESYRKHLAQYCQSNGITVVTPYELRHTSFSIMQTLPEGLVKAAGGHSRNMDTFGVYGHEVQGDKALTAKLLQKRFSDLLSNFENQCQNKVKPEK